MQNETRRWDTAFAISTDLENYIVDITTEKYWMSLTVDIEGERWSVWNLHLPTSWAEAGEWGTALETWLINVNAKRTSYGNHTMCAMGDFNLDCKGCGARLDCAHGRLVGDDAHPAPAMVRVRAGRH